MGNNKYNYGPDFEKLYVGIAVPSGNSKKMACYMMFKRMEKKLNVEIERVKADLEKKGTE